MTSLFDFPITKVDLHAILYWTVSVINFWIKFLDFFLDNLFGYSIRNGSRREREQALKEGRTVQLVQILMRGIYAETYTQTPENYVYYHKRYVSPEYILEKDKATLQGVTKTHFFFCITINPNFNVVDTRISPFMFALQFWLAERLLIVPHNVLHKLADDIGDPKARITFLDMTGRCGSTLICTMLSNVPGVRTFSEPWAFLHAHGQYLNGHIDRVNYRKLLKTIIRILCKREHEINISRILIKFTIFINCQIEVLKEVYPDATFMFISRHLQQSMRSYVKFTQNVPKFAVAKRSVGTKFCFDHMSLPYGDKTWENIRLEWRDKRAQPGQYSILISLFMMYIGQIVTFQKFKSMYDHRMLYEDVMADPDYHLKKIFDVMKIERKYIPDAKKGLNYDSQQGRYGKRGNDHIKIPDNYFEECESLLKEYNSPISIDMSMEELRKIIY